MTKFFYFFSSFHKTLTITKTAEIKKNIKKKKKKIERERDDYLQIVKGNNNYSMWTALISPSKRLQDESQTHTKKMKKIASFHSQIWIVLMGFILPSGRFNVVVQFIICFSLFCCWWWCFSPEVCWSEHGIRLLNHFVLNSLFHYIFVHFRNQPVIACFCWSDPSVSYMFCFFIFLVFFLFSFFLMPSIFFLMSIVGIIVVIWPCLASKFLFFLKLWFLNSFRSKIYFGVLILFNMELRIGLMGLMGLMVLHMSLTVLF